MLDEQDTLDGDRSVSVTDVVIRPQVLHEQWKDREKLRLRELCPEGIEKADSVDLKERVHGSRGRLEVLEDVLGEELDDVDQGVGRGDTMLWNLISTADL